MILTEEQRHDLESLGGDRGYDRSPAARAQMVLWRDEGYSAQEIAEKAGTCKKTVYYWWERYDREGPAGLETRPNPGPVWEVSGRDRARILALTKQTPPEETGLSRWTAAEMSRYLARCENIRVSPVFVAELWRDSGIKPHRHRTFKLSQDPFLDVKTRDVVTGLYITPP